MDYAVARVSGFRRHLVGKRGLAELAAQPDLAGRVDLLRRLGLVAGRGLSLREVERELRSRLARDVATVDRLLDGTRARDRLRAVLAIGDAWTLKTIMRGLEHSEPSTRLLALVLPTLELDEGALKELVAQRRVRPMIDLLATWGHPYAEPLRDELRRTRGQVDLAALEVALDRFVVARARRAVARDEDLTAYLVEVIHMADALARAKLGADAAKVDPLALEQLAERRPLAVLRRRARMSPLSLAVPLLYLLERRAEVRAIRLILEGGELGLPGGELLDWVEASP